MSFDQLTEAYKKDFGDNIGGEGFNFGDLERIPTGWFPFDLATGGGFVKCRYTEIFGKESSCKSNCAYRAVAMHQKLWPEKKCAWFDIEGTHDPVWARKLGVDTDKLYVFRPDYAEAVVDMVEGLMGSPECGLIVIDSLAAMMPVNEVESSAEKTIVGGNSRVVSALIRKIVGTYTRVQKLGYTPTVIGINQIRYKIGGYGNPETTGGGNARLFAQSLRIRFWGNDKKDPKYHKDLPIAKDVSFIIQKHKFPIVCASGQMDIVTIPHKGLKVGECDDFGLVKQYLEKHGMLEKQKTKWVFMEQEYGTLKEIRAILRDDVKLANNIKSAIIQAEIELANGDGDEDQEDNDSDTDDNDNKAGKASKKSAKKKKKGKKK